MSTKRGVYEIANFKASTDTPGEFTADVSVFGNVDKQGDRVMPGAFAKSLKEWDLSGNPIPVIWNHDWDDPYAHVGYVTRAVETPTALRITGKNDVGKPYAAQVHDLLTSRRVTGMSFSYEVEDERRAKDGAIELTRLRLIEVGPTLQGANQSAQLVNAKSLLSAAAEEELGEAPAEETRVALGLDVDAKAGRRLSQATQAEMQAIHDDMTAVQERMRALMGMAEDEPKSAEKSVGPEDDTSSEITEGALDGDADLNEVESEASKSDTEGPAVKVPDPSVTSVLTRIAELRATTGISA